MRFAVSIFALGLILIGFSSHAFAQSRQVAQMQRVTGEHWTKATDDQKKAFLYGFATLLAAEHEIQGNPAPKNVKSIVPTFFNGLTGMTFTDLQTAIDQYYQQNPSQLQRPVLEVMWFEIAVPNLQKK